MAVNISLSQEALSLINSRSYDGGSMIATCRAIFSGHYDDEIYQSGLFDTFQMICDGSDNFVLNGFGMFNSIHKSSKPVEGSENRDEIEAIYRAYFSSFEKSLNEFRQKFQL